MRAQAAGRSSTSCSTPPAPASSALPSGRAGLSQGESGGGNPSPYLILSYLILSCLILSYLKLIGGGNPSPERRPPAMVGTWQRPSTAPALMWSRWRNGGLERVFVIILKGGGLPQRGGCNRPFQVGGGAPGSYWEGKIFNCISGLKLHFSTR